MHGADVASQILVRLQWFILVYFLVVNGFYGLLLVSAVGEMWQYALKVRGESRWRILRSRVAPKISILVPAHDEARTIGESVLALLTHSYPALEVVVVDDGSRDRTMAVLVEKFALVQIHPIFRRRLATRPVRAIYRSRVHQHLVVVQKANGGKADALNAASAELVCAIDADTLLEPDALQRMVRPFLARSDVARRVGTIRVANGSRIKWGRVVAPRVPRRALARFQVVEYLRAFLFGRLGWNRLGGNLIISGAFGLFSREAVIASGGYASGALAEDMELILRLRRHGYETGARRAVEFIPDPVAWTEVPESLAVLGRQRARWHNGLADALWRHRSAVLSHRYGALGLVVLPYFIFVELFAPIVEAVGLLSIASGLVLGWMDVEFAVLFFLVAYVFGLILTVFAFVLEEVSFRRYTRMRERLILLAFACLEPLGFRQLTVLWRLRGLLDFLRRHRSWGEMERRGFQVPTEVGAS